MRSCIASRWSRVHAGARSAPSSPRGSRWRRSPVPAPRTLALVGQPGRVRRASWPASPRRTRRARASTSPASPCTPPTPAGRSRRRSPPWASRSTPPPTERRPPATCACWTARRSWSSTPRPCRPTTHAALAADLAALGHHELHLAVGPGGGPIGAGAHPGPAPPAPRPRRSDRPAAPGRGAPGRDRRRGARSPSSPALRRPGAPISQSTRRTPSPWRGS